MMMFFLAQTAPAAPAPGATPPASPGVQIFMQLLPFLLMGVIIWVLLIRPERRKQKRHREMLSQLSKNDHVVTTGGVFGIVKAVSDEEVTLLVDEKHDVTIRVMRRFVGAKITDDSPAGELPTN
jgi:preprotein translocase subunit YajC